MRTWPVRLSFFLLLLPWFATASPAAGATVSYAVDGETVQAYLANHAGSGGAPGLVVIHEFWGLNEQIMRVADRLSRLGYVAIAPDLFRGRLPGDPGLAQEMMAGLDENRAVSIVKGAVGYLRKLDNATHRPVATVGFGMGGRISLATALRGADVQATVIFYGAVETTNEGVAPIKAPLLGLFAGRDAGIPVKDAKKFEAALKETGKDATIIIYEGVGHAFFNERRPDYDPETAKDSWIRMQDWLAAKLMPDLSSGPGPRTGGGPSGQGMPGGPPGQKTPAPAPTPGR